MTTIAIRSFDLPWTLDPVAERRFRRILRDVCVVALVLGVVAPWLPLPERAAEPPAEVPQRYAELLLERKPPPPPPPVVAPEPEPVAPVEAVAEAPPPPADRPADVPSPPSPSARDRAAAAGVMAFADSLAALRRNDAVDAATSDRGLAAGAGEAERTERSLVTGRSGRASGGINTAALSRNVGGAGVGGRSVTAVAGPAVGNGPAAGGAGGGGDGPGGLAARSREEIELVFDRNKAAIYALYSRALRSDPTLQGKLVLRLTIAPSGEVTDCEVVASELTDADFERRLVARVKMFRFEAKDVATVTTTKPIEFFPA